jgi:hypothetical protein
LSSGLSRRVVQLCQQHPNSTEEKLFTKYGENSVAKIVTGCMAKERAAWMKLRMIEGGLLRAFYSILYNN